MPRLLRSPYLHIAAFTGLVIGGARLSDTLIHYTIPDDPCRVPLMTLTVIYLGTILLLSLAYLGALVMAIVDYNWRAWLHGRTWMHTFGCATLCFSALSPFIVLHGRHSGVAYGERVAVIEGIGQSIAAQTAIEAYWAAHQRFPANAAEAGWNERVGSPSTAARRIAIAPKGRVTIHFHAARYADLDGRTLVLTPAVTIGGLRWDCRGGSLPDLVRPVMCRRSVVCDLWR
jgi:type IV pilus assembly protein PilA